MAITSWAGTVLAADPCQLVEVELGEDLPGDVQGLLDGTVLVDTLADDPILEDVGEVQELPVLGGEGVLSDDGHETAQVLTLGVGCIQLVGDVLVVLTGLSGSGSSSHQPAEG